MKQPPDIVVLVKRENYMLTTERTLKRIYRRHRRRTFRRKKKDALFEVQKEQMGTEKAVFGAKQ